MVTILEKPSADYQCEENYFCHYSTLNAFAKQLQSFQYITSPIEPFPTATEKLTSDAIEQLRHDLNCWFMSLKFGVAVTIDEIRQVILVLYRKQSQAELRDSNLNHESLSSIKDLSFFKTILSPKEKKKSKRIKRRKSQGIQIEPEERQNNHNRLATVARQRRTQSEAYRKLSKSNPGIEPNPESARTKRVSSSSSDPEDQSTDEELNYQELNEENLLISCTEKLQLGSSLEDITESILAQILSYSGGTDLCLFRNSMSGKLYCEALISKHIKCKNWSILKRIPISSLDIPSLTLITESRQSMRPVFATDRTKHVRKYVNSRNPKEEIHSVVCIPILSQRKFNGAVYISSTSNQTYDYLNVCLVSSICTNLLNMIDTSILKTKLVKRKTQELLTPKAKCVPGALLQDSIISFDSENCCWEKNFVVVTKDYLLEYSSPHDTNPLRKISIFDISNISVYSGNKQLAEEAFCSGNELANFGRFRINDSLVHITFNDNESCWYIMNCKEYSLTWKATVEQFRKTENSTPCKIE